VQDFSRDFSAVVSKVLARYQDHEETADADVEAIHNQLYEVKPGTAEHHALSQEQKEIKKLAKRIVKAVKEPLEDALRKEAELKGREHEEAIRKLDSMGIFASEKDVELDELGEDGNMAGKRRSNSDLSAVAGAADGDAEMRDADDEPTDDPATQFIPAATLPASTRKPNPASKSTRHTSPHRNSISAATTTRSEKPTEPLSPPISTDSLIVTAKLTTEPATVPDTDVFAQGGVPWYLSPFDPVGTTVHEERYTGREVLRDMTEELSDMDEVTLTELGVSGVEGTPKGGREMVGSGGGGGGGADGVGEEDAGVVATSAKKTPARRKGRFTKRMR